MIAGTLELQMLANMARLADDMSKAKNLVGDAVGTINKVLGTIGVGFSAAFLIEKLDSVTERMAKLHDAAEKTGGSVEDLSRLQFFANASGSNIDAVTSALAKLSKGMVSTGVEGAASTQALNALQLSAKDAAGNLKDPASLFSEIAQKLAGYQDGAGKSAIATALFGKSGAELLPTLKKLAEMGYIEASVTTEQAKRADEYHLSLARLGQQKEALWNTIVGELLPSMNDVVKVLLDASKKTDSLQNAAKSLAQDGSIESWADKGAMAVAILIDAVMVLPKIFSAVSSSFMVVLADIELANKAANLNPVNAAISIAKGQNPLADFKIAIDARNAILADADAKYEALLNGEVNATQKAMAATIKARNDAATTLAFTGGGSGENGKKLNFSLGDPAKIAAELKLYQNALQALEQELGKLNNQTQEEKTIYQLVYGSLQKLTPAHADYLLQVSREVDLKKQLLAVDAAALDFAKAQEAEQDRMDSAIAGFSNAQVDTLKNIELETEALRQQGALNSAGLLQKSDEIMLTAQVNQAMEIANALRQIDINLQNEILKLGPETNAGYEEASARLRDLAEAQKQAIPDAIAQRDAAKLANDLAKNQADEFKALWSTVESTGKDVFIHVFSDGKSAFEGIGQAIKASVIDLLYQITAKKWIINIGASISGAGASGVASAAGNGGISGLSNLFSFGSGGGVGSLVQDLGVSLGSQGIADAGTFLAESGIGTAIPYVGAALGLAKVLGVFGGGSTPSVLQGLRTTGTIGASGFQGSTMAYDQLGNQWSVPEEDAWLRSLTGEQFITGNLNSPQGQIDHYNQLFGDARIPVDFTSTPSENIQAKIAEIAASFTDAADAQIKATDAQTAAAQKAADAIKAAWQDATNSIVDEINRIKGISPSGETLAAARAQFAISTAQARAGDIDAAKLLPGLAQSIIDLATATATTALDVQRARMQVLGSLETTVGGAVSQYGLTVPSFASGTNYIPHTGLYQLHQGETVSTAEESSEMISELKALRAEMSQIRKDTQKTTRNIEAVANGQLSFSTVPG